MHQTNNEESEESGGSAGIQGSRRLLRGRGAGCGGGAVSPEARAADTAAAWHPWHWVAGLFLTSVLGFCYYKHFILM